MNNLLLWAILVILIVSVVFSILSYIKLNKKKESYTHANNSMVIYQNADCGQPRPATKVLGVLSSDGTGKWHGSHVNWKLNNNTLSLGSYTYNVSWVGSVGSVQIGNESCGISSKSVFMGALYPYGQ